MWTLLRLSAVDLLTEYFCLACILADALFMIFSLMWAGNMNGFSSVLASAKSTALGGYSFILCVLFLLIVFFLTGLFCIYLTSSCCSASCLGLLSGVIAEASLAGSLAPYPSKRF